MEIIAVINYLTKVVSVRDFINATSDFFSGSVRQSLSPGKFWLIMCSPRHALQSRFNIPLINAVPTAEPAKRLLGRSPADQGKNPQVVKARKHFHNDRYNKRNSAGKGLKKR